MRKADELIERFLDTIGNQDGLTYVELFKSWKRVAGSPLADHTRPVDVRGGSLIVESDHPGWSQMLIMKRSRILGALTQRFPDLQLTGLTIHLASELSASSKEHSDAAAPQDDRWETTPRAPSGDDKEALTRIHDSELRESLSRLHGELRADE